MYLDICIAAPTIQWNAGLRVQLTSTRAWRERIAHPASSTSSMNITCGAIVGRSFLLILTGSSWGSLSSSNFTGDDINKHLSYNGFGSPPPSSNVKVWAGRRNPAIADDDSRHCGGIVVVVLVELSPVESNYSTVQYITVQYSTIAISLDAGTTRDRGYG
jgi:hypothetical protein